MEAERERLAGATEADMEEARRIAASISFNWLDKDCAKLPDVEAEAFEDIAQAIATALAREREACAKVVQEQAAKIHRMNALRTSAKAPGKPCMGNEAARLDSLAATIRQRGGTRE